MWSDFQDYAEAQAGVEYLNPKCMGSVTATPIVQPCCQYVIPAVIKPLLTPEPAIETRPPAMAEYPPFYPPIIIQEDNDWHHLLYFLIFAMQNRRFDSCNRYCCPPNPYPVPYGFAADDIPNNVCIPYPYQGPDMPGDEVIIVQSPSIQPIEARDNEVTLIIRTDK